MKPVKKRCLTAFHFADAELQRKCRAVLSFADDDPADADNSPLAGDIIALQDSRRAFADTATASTSLTFLPNTSAAL